MARRLFELPDSMIPVGVRVEFFADRECSEPVALSMTASSTSGRSSVVMPRSMPALYADSPRVFARWSQPVSDLSAGSVGEQVFVRPCREVRRMVVSGSW